MTRRNIVEHCRLWKSSQPEGEWGDEQWQELINLIRGNKTLVELILANLYKRKEPTSAAPPGMTRLSREEVFDGMKRLRYYSKGSAEGLISISFQCETAVLILRWRGIDRDPIPGKRWNRFGKDASTVLADFNKWAKSKLSYEELRRTSYGRGIGLLDNATEACIRCLEQVVESDFDPEVIDKFFFPKQADEKVVNFRR
jgi:hypothetical protein